MADTFDAVVISGGVARASTRYRQTRLGCRKAVPVEQGEPAEGLTARSYGVVRTHHSVARYVEGERLVGDCGAGAVS